MTKRAIFSIVSCNYFHYAKTLMQSVRKVDLISDLLVVLVDDGYNPEDYASKIFDVIKFKNIPIPDRKKMCFQYDILELNTAVKPFAIKHLFSMGYGKVVYLDPDIFVYGSLERTFCSLESHDIVVTPHLTEPLADKFRPADLDILRAGIYNLGFFAAKATIEVEKFVDWWAEKLVDQCRVAISEGIFVDQKWCDFIPSFVRHVLVDHDPGMNVAYWNLKHREVTEQNGAYFVGSSRLVFFHFSGLGLNGLSILSRHEDRFESLGLPKIIDRIKNNYLERLKKNGSNFYSRQPYNFDHFTDSSVKIPKAVRELYRTNRLVRAVFGADPFDMSRDPGFQKTYNKKIYGKKIPITLLCDSIYKSRPDLQAAFPDCAENNGFDLCRWFLKSATLEYGLDDVFVSVMRDGLNDIARPTAGLAILKQGLVNRVLAVAAKFSRPNHGAIQDQRPSSTLAYYCNRLAKPAIHWAYRIAKRVLGLDRCHRIREAISQSLLKSYGGKSEHKVVHARKRHRDDGLNIIGYLTAELGLGEAARATIRAATAAGISISAINFTDGCNSRKSENVAADVDKSPRHFVNLVHVNADQTLALLKGLGKNFFLDRYNIGYWMWETTEFPSEFLKSLEHYDEIWTASEFCREVLARKSLKPVVKIPHSMHMSLSKPDSQLKLGLPAGSFTFFNMVDFFSFPERKNPLGVIEAFIKAFGTESDDVRLIVKISNSFHRPEVNRIIKNRIQGIKSITLIEGYMDRSSLNSLMSNIDCYVSLHRSEGFGLPIAEAMSLGKPVIATGWSGNMEFMDNSNSFPVKYELTEISLQDGPYKNAGCWAEPNCDHAAELMTYVVGHPNVAQEVGSLAKKKMLEEYSPEAIGSRMRDRLGWIQESLN